MTKELEHKVEQAIKLIRSSARYGLVVEVAYSGGKDSDVILELTKMADIKYKAIYKNTTIDPPGTIKHVKEMGADIIQPKETFFDIIASSGLPNRFQRKCCRILKESAVLPIRIEGIRKAESFARKKRYEEPTACMHYGNSKSRINVQVFYPLLEWSDEDLLQFILERKLQLHPLYYREDGSIDIARRLGCLCCPLIYYKKRIGEFQKYPRMVRAYIRSMTTFRLLHPHSLCTMNSKDAYEWFVREIFFERPSTWADHKLVTTYEHIDYQNFLESYFNISLTL